MKKLLLATLALTSVITFSETIHQIQGVTHTSPYNQKMVKNVRGIVTAVVKDGFYMQSRKFDRNIKTSEGIYVESKNLPNVGEYVSVNGMVYEKQFGRPSESELTVTSIKAGDDIKVISKGNKVKAVNIDPRKVPMKVYVGKFHEKLNPKKNAMDFYESLEGMLVKVHKPLITGADEDRGEVCVVPEYGKYVKDKTNHGGVRYTYKNEQTQRILIKSELFKLSQGKRYEGKYIDPSFTPNPGDRFSRDIQGVLTYDKSNYKLINTSPLPKIKDGKIKRDKLNIKYDKNKLSIVSYNIENFTIADGGQKRVDVLAKQVRDDLHTPDILGLAEVGDNDGGNVTSKVVSADKVLDAIVEGIKKATGVEYKWLSADPEDGKDGGWPAMHIRNAILYRTDKLELPYFKQGDSKVDTEIKEGKLTFNPGRLGNNKEFYKDVRKSLVAHLVLKDSKKDVFIVVNHLKSKRFDDKIYSKNQPVKRKSEDLRIPEGKYVGQFLKEINKQKPNAIILSMGDMNDFEFSPTLKAMKTNLMVSAVESLPKNQRHTYVYQGNSQVLDNLLVNKKYAKGMKVDILNINSEFTISQGYFSDHDPVYMQINVK
ncbi:cell surface protein [uncultured Sneathia sp.]|uniref:cell surface protein n=1 Tax=uncultured Sneathia sp. TaxID=278067 RepID=UPI0028044E4A|nr:cell surface protein [uncultured Sneathia sp.]